MEWASSHGQMEGVMMESGCVEKGTAEEPIPLPGVITALDTGLKTGSYAGNKIRVSRTV